MQKYKIGFSAILFSLLILPQLVLAHEHDVFKIGNKTYQITIGSLNEPLIVDDKSGLDLTVMQGSGMPTMGPDGDMDGPAAASTPVTGLEKTLKVEMDAGSQKKIFDLTPAYGKAGAYATTFFPTVQTTFSYRLFGTINNISVDLSFTCNPSGHTVTPDDNTQTKIADNVTRLSKSGAFGCMEAKAPYGFPEASLTSSEIKDQLQNSASGTNTTKSFAITALALSVVSLAASARGFSRRKT